MTCSVGFSINEAGEEQIAQHLQLCDSDFVPPLSERTDLAQYARKIANAATRFEARVGAELVGLLAVYCNDRSRRAAFITSVSVMRRWQNKGIAAKLLSRCIDHLRAIGFDQVSLEADLQNSDAIRFYRKHKFITDTKESTAGCAVVMRLDIGILDR